jgi:hypothetical protein
MPPLLLFAFAHIGQPGYFLLVLPAVLLAVGALLDDRFPTPGLGRLPTVPAAAGLVGLALVANLALWFASARALDRIVQIPGPVREIRETLTGYVPLYGLLPSRIDWPLLRSRLDQYAPGEVMLMTSAGILGPFRHLQYYYPDHSLHGIWMTPDDGWFFRSILPSGPYGPGEARVPVASIPVPEGVRAIVVIDNPFVECLSQRGPVRVERIGGDHRMYTLTSVTDRELRLTTDCLGNAPPEPD